MTVIGLMWDGPLSGKTFPVERRGDGSYQETVVFPAEPGGPARQHEYQYSGRNAMSLPSGMPIYSFRASL